MRPSSCAGLRTPWGHGLAALSHWGRPQGWGTLGERELPDLAVRRHSVPMQVHAQTEAMPSETQLRCSPGVASSLGVRDSRAAPGLLEPEVRLLVASPGGRKEGLTSEGPLVLSVSSDRFAGPGTKEDFSVGVRAGVAACGSGSRRPGPVAPRGRCSGSGFWLWSLCTVRSSRGAGLQQERETGPLLPGVTCPMGRRCRVSRDAHGGGSVGCSLPGLQEEDRRGRRETLQEEGTQRKSQFLKCKNPETTPLPAQQLVQNQRRLTPGRLWTPGAQGRSPQGSSGPGGPAEERGRAPCLFTPCFSPPPHSGEGTAPGPAAPYLPCPPRWVLGSHEGHLGRSGAEAAATAKQGLGGGLDTALGAPAAHLEQENRSQGVLTGLGAVLGKLDTGHPSRGGRATSLALGATRRWCGRGARTVGRSCWQPEGDFLCPLNPPGPP